MRHLERAGFAGAPRAVAIEGGEEVLSFLPGRAGVAPYPPGMHADPTLERIAHLVRRYHDATTTFRPPTDAAWRFLLRAPREGEVVCHNDLSPANTVYASGRPIAFVDWDLAAPGPRTWDVAYALWRFVPLYGDADCRRLGLPVRPRGPRIRLFCDAYGLGSDERAAIIDTVRGRQQAQWLRSIRFLDEHREAWERSLR